MEATRPPSPQPQTNGGGAPPRGGGGGASWGQNNKARCYIGNLVPDITESDVRTHFSKYFPKRCDMKGGYAFIEFETETDALDAIQYMDGSTLLERGPLPREPTYHDRSEQDDIGACSWSGLTNCIKLPAS